MVESIKQKLGFVVAAIMVAAAVAVLNLGAPAGAQQQGCGDGGGGGGGGGGGTPSASPSPTESEEPFPPPIPPILPEETESSSPTPTETTDAARKCSSDISLNYKGPTKKKPSRRLFTGKVTSAEDECEVGRKVALKKQKKGRDKTFDTTVTNNKGSFKMAAKRANGRYYAQIPKENVADDDGRIVCGGAKSKTVKV